MPAGWTRSWSIIRGLTGFGGECKASPWTDSPAVLVKLMSKIRCLSGVTQIAAVLKHTSAGSWST